MEKTIDYAEEYLQLKNKEMWHKAETYAQLEENSLKEKSQFNDFVNFKVKQGRELERDIIFKNEIFSCPKCKVSMKHLKEIHTFKCQKCQHKEWYPDRIFDDRLWNDLKKELQKEVE